VDDGAFGAAVRVLRIRRGWRQSDLAAAAHVSRATLSRIERGLAGGIVLDRLRAIAKVLDMRLALLARWRGAELDRLINAAHSALHEEVAEFFEPMTDWVLQPEVSFSFYGERGVIDCLGYHAIRGVLLVIELKTDLVDIQEMIGKVDRKRRLALKIAEERGWKVSMVAVWVILADSPTNARRIERHRSVLRAAFPDDGRTMAGWLRAPARAVSALSLWKSRSVRTGMGGRGLATRQRVARRHDGPTRRAA
jgi:transcriptional regulator with XRE-family HTH domain